MKSNIIVNLQYEAIHYWPNCNIKEVEFLKHPHRHIFHICCKKEVTHNDRDIEIIKLKREILFYLNEEYQGNFVSRSCEMIAEELMIIFKLNYCRVLEDNENGAEVIL
tara:strand:+ start:82 stop:405 length:324 start_codon:yes stop_codon:yes gene_type:complete